MMSGCEVGWTGSKCMIGELCAWFLCLDIVLSEPKGTCFKNGLLRFVLCLNPVSGNTFF